jgi:4'-phosphopantetheinyl transferase
MGVPDVPLPAAGLPDVDLGGTVVVQLAGRATTRAGDHRMLVTLVSRLTGVDPAAVILDQVCPNCGVTGHGPLRASLGGAAGPGRAVHVSLARAAGWLALAVTAAGPVGIDLESIKALRRAPVADVLLSGAESRSLAALDRADTERAFGVIWTSKEAVLKAARVGLRVDPRELTVALPTTGIPTPAHSPGRTVELPAPAGWPTLATWPAAPFALAAVHLHPLLAPGGTVGTVGVVSVARPGLVQLPAPAAR